MERNDLGYGALVINHWLLVTDSWVIVHWSLVIYYLGLDEQMTNNE
jgi:hypothetical protein